MRKAWLSRYNRPMNRPQVERPDIDERGAAVDGRPQVSTTRLFMQLQVYGGCADTSAACNAVREAGVPGVVYEDVNDPAGVAVLSWSEDPGFFVTQFRRLLTGKPFVQMTHRPEMTMFGRTYALGHEPDLRQWLFDKPITTATNAAWPWAVWYPLRRRGAFAALPEGEQRKILMEHGQIGMGFVQADLAHDIRLVCTGLDRNDNDFVIGLVARELHPLSAIVQAMRKTTQTSHYIEKLGPFFVGRAVYQGRG
jgi:hypothetical protein